MKNKNVSIGVSFGILIGLIYMILLFVRWMSAENMIRFGLLAAVNYLLVIGLLAYEAFYRRKLEGGFILLKDIFQTLFISVLIFELFYAIYNLIHLKYIDPEVIDRMKNAMREMMEKYKVPEEDAQKSMDKFNEFDNATKFGQVIKGYLTGVAISGVCAFIISLIVRKKEPVFEENINL